jgi:hypothetical protein
VKIAPELIALYDEYTSDLTSPSAKSHFALPIRCCRPLTAESVVDAVPSGDASGLEADFVTLGITLFDSDM